MKTGYAIFLLLLFAFFTLNFQCDKEPYLVAKYEFAEKLEMYPVRKSYALHDTLWIELAKTNKQLFDTKSNQVISMDTGSIAAGINIKGLYQTPVNSFGNFSVIDAVSADSFNHDTFGIYVKKLCSEPDFHFRVGYVVKTRGYYALSVGVNAVSSCNPATVPLTSYSSIRYTFNISDGGRDVYLEIPESVRKKYAHTWLDSGMDTRNVFVFKVE